MIVLGANRCSALAVGMLVLLVLATTGCGGAPNRGVRRYDDELMTSANRMGRYAFEKGKYDQAAENYSRALERAYIRGDASAILDARYNLAVCQMELGHYPEAMRLIDQAKADLAAGAAAMPPDLLLLEATILFRKGEPEQALAVTDALLASPVSPSPKVQAKTHFLRGLIADEQKETTRLRKAIAAMGQPENEVIQADVFELQGRLAMAEKNWPAAITALDMATTTRRKYFDYRRMAITLALSADALEQAGQSEQAAARYLQAGRSAALRGDNAQARQWLSQAVRLFDLIGQPDRSVEAAAILSGLETVDRSDN